MDLNDYQKRASVTATYPEQDAVVYTTLGLTNEAGEVAGVLKKELRGDFPADVDVTEMMVKELGDVLWYLAMLAKALGYSLEKVAQMNLDKLADRAARGVIKGSGDDR